MSSKNHVPDFIIAGSTKCGTTSIKHILRAHDEIFIPKQELWFFSLDDIHMHRHLFIHFRNEWVTQDFERDYEENVEWYHSFYEDAPKDKICGEDSPSYLTSEVAPQRIRRLIPDVKLIFSLRNPVDRAYSQYWADLENNKTLFDFEGALQHGPDRLLRMGYYKEALERYFGLFDRNQILVLIFENFVSNTQNAIDRICNFIGCEHSLDIATVPTHHNPSTQPGVSFLKYLEAWMRAFGPATQSPSHAPNMKKLSRDEIYRRMGAKELCRHFTAAALGRLNDFLSDPGYPPMRSETREFLQAYYTRKNAGLSQLIGEDLSEHWGMDV